MNPTLKTYSDGSEITLANAAVFVGAATLFALGTALVVSESDRIKNRIFRRKNTTVEIPKMLVK